MVTDSSGKVGDYMKGGRSIEFESLTKYVLIDYFLEKQIRILEAYRIVSAVMP